MNSATYNRLEYGRDHSPGEFLDAARYALLADLNTAKARWVIGIALDLHGPETVYMDGELWSYR